MDDAAEDVGDVDVEADGVEAADGPEADGAGPDDPCGELLCAGELCAEGAGDADVVALELAGDGDESGLGSDGPSPDVVTLWEGRSPPPALLVT
ncbi:MAG: hypothetical protein AAF468_11990 [Pseudomonadota bacterium]